MSRYLAVFEEIEYNKRRNFALLDGDVVTIVAIHIMRRGSYVYFNIEPEKVWYFVPGAIVVHSPGKTHKLWKFFPNIFSVERIIEFLSRIPVRDVELFRFEADRDMIPVTFDKWFILRGMPYRKFHLVERRIYQSVHPTLTIEPSIVIEGHRES